MSNAISPKQASLISILIKSNFHRQFNHLLFIKLTQAQAREIIDYLDTNHVDINNIPIYIEKLINDWDTKTVTQRKKYLQDILDQEDAEMELADRDLVLYRLARIEEKKVKYQIKKEKIAYLKEHPLTPEEKLINKTARLKLVAENKIIKETFINRVTSDKQIELMNRLFENRNIHRGFEYKDLTFIKAKEVIQFLIDSEIHIERVGLRL